MDETIITIDGNLNGKVFERFLNEDGDLRVKLNGRIELDSPVSISKRHGRLIIEGTDNAIISGGREIVDFESLGGGLFKAKLNDGEYSRHLYIDNKKASRPHTAVTVSVLWDKLESPEYAFHGEKRSYVDRWKRDFSIYSAIESTNVNIASFRNTRDIELVFEVGWVHAICPLERVYMENGKVILVPVAPCYQALQCLGGVFIGSCPNYLDNVFECLEPGQWYIDRAERALYVMLEDGDSIKNHEIVLPLAERLLNIEADNVSITGVKFMHSTYLAPAIVGHSEIQANVTVEHENFEALLDSEHDPLISWYHKTPSAIRVAKSKNVCFVGCEFTLLGSGALDFENGAQDCHADYSHFHDIAGSAVQLGDVNIIDSHPHDKSEIVRQISICDNLIHDTGFDYKGSVAIFAGYVQDVFIAHNDIFNVPYSAISVGWGWAEADMSYADEVRPEGSKPPKNFKMWTEPSICKRNKIMYNHIHHSMCVLNDGGAIYTLGEMNGSAIIGNLIHDSAGHIGPGFDGLDIGGIEFTTPEATPFHGHGFPGGIYMDEGSAGIEVSDNIIYNVAVPLFYHNQIHEGYKRVSVHDNVLNIAHGDAGYPETIAGRRELY